MARDLFEEAGIQGSPQQGGRDLFGPQNFSQMMQGMDYTPPPMPERAPSVGQDLAESIAGVPRAMWGVAKQLPGELMGAAGQLNPFGARGDRMEDFVTSRQGGEVQERDGYRPLRQFAAGAAEGAQGLMNVPGNIVDYAKSRGAPDWLDAWRPSDAIRDFDWQKQMGLEGEQAGDRLFRSAGSLASTAPWAGGSLAPTLGLEAVGRNEDPLQAAIVGELLPRAIKAGGKGLVKAGGAAVDATKGLSDIASKTGEAIKESVKGVPEAMSKTKTMDQIVKANKELKAEVSRGFNEPLAAAEDLDIKGRIKPSAQRMAQKLAKDGGAKYSKALKKYQQDPTDLNKMHKAQSAAGKMANDPKLDFEVREGAGKFRDARLTEIEKAFNEAGHKGYGKQYADARKLHAEKGRLTNNQVLKKYARKDLTAGEAYSDLTKNKGNRAFMNKIGKDVPAEKLRTRAKLGLEVGAVVGALATGQIMPYIGARIAGQLIKGRK